MKEEEIQRQYYADTADKYNEMHVQNVDEHSFALAWMLSALDHLGIKSVLDIGSGTGRVISYVMAMRSDIHIVGVEPVKELREVAYKRGVLESNLIEGDARHLQFSDGEVDLVCAFGVLHHIKSPEPVVAEMLRVAKKAIFISDSNNFGQGSFVVRSIKQGLNLLRLWKIADRIKTKGRGYTISKGDGLAYSYSVFNNYRQIRQLCRRIHLLNTSDASINHYHTASHVALLGVKY